MVDGEGDEEHHARLAEDSGEHVVLAHSVVLHQCRYFDEAQRHVVEDGHGVEGFEDGGWVYVGPFAYVIAQAVDERW